MSKEKQLQVEAIAQGTVIDHIPAQVGLQVLKLFNFDKTGERVTMGLNLPSSAMGCKDILKAENTFISEEQAQKLALYAPKATVNQIENYEVVKKLNLSLPKQVLGVFSCPNANCITHNEPVPSRFAVSTKVSKTSQDEEIRLRCTYCEKTFDRDIVTEG